MFYHLPAIRARVRGATADWTFCPLCLYQQSARACEGRREGAANLPTLTPAHRTRHRWTDGRRPSAEPYRELVVAVVVRAVDDLQNPHRLLRMDAARFVAGPGFGMMLELAGIAISSDQCRETLRRRGLLDVSRPDPYEHPAPTPNAQIRPFPPRQWLVCLQAHFTTSRARCRS